MQISHGLDDSKSRMDVLFVVNNVSNSLFHLFFRITLFIIFSVLSSPFRSSSSYVPLSFGVTYISLHPKSFTERKAPDILSLSLLFGPFGKIYLWI